jgi:hypothetical protein
MKKDKIIIGNISQFNNNDYYYESMIEYKAKDPISVINNPKLFKGSNEI